ncbi:MAG TPA: YggS family pyridoxal phosphate enzyme [Acidimicrobiales bacterium]
MSGPFPGFEERLAGIRARIMAASPDPDGVTLVTVTKGFGPEAVRTAVASGLTVVGENYADELVAKAAAVADDPGPAPEWHFLGTIQRNKVPRLAPLVSCWQAVGRIEEGRAIARRQPGARVLVQVDVAGLPGRGGVPPAQVPDLVAALRDEELDVAGLMAVGPPGLPEDARPGFREVGRLADELALPVRSMGMTDDLEVALSEGATMVRLGRALFGERPPRN